MEGSLERVRSRVRSSSGSFLERSSWIRWRRSSEAGPVTSTRRLTDRVSVSTGFRLEGWGSSRILTGEASSHNSGPLRDLSRRQAERRVEERQLPLLQGDQGELGYEDRKAERREPHRILGGGER